jgi:EPS-associated MarR family transcriptional regulator
LALYSNYLQKNVYSSINEQYNVQKMNIKFNKEHFEILRKIAKNSQVSQRNLSKELKLSLGKINYCLNKLKEKGLIKIKNFENNKNKIKYLYLLTPKGVAQKTDLTIKFMKLKMQEYDELKKEMEKK